MTTTEWVERYNRAFEEARSDYWLVNPAWDAAGYVPHCSIPPPSAIQAKECVLSPFEPKEVVDDGPVGQNVLNQKETHL